MSIFSKKSSDAENDGVRNPIDEIQGNRDYSGKTFIQDNPSNNSNSMTIIETQTSVEGIIKVDGDITINGKVKGSITAKGKTIVGTNGMVEGDILAQNADISGNVSGKVEIADLLSLKGQAIIDGDIYTDKLVIEKEASFNGKCVMGKDTKGANKTTPVTPKKDTNDSLPKENALNP